MANTQFKLSKYIIPTTISMVLVGTYTKEEKVKQWLIWAVSRAEAELGAGEGQMKLRRVYDAFLKRFPVVAEAVSFKTFGRWVDGALAEVQAMLVQKKAAEQKKGGGSIDK